MITKFLDLAYPNSSVDLDDGLLNRRVIRLAREWKCLYVLDRMLTGLQISTHPDIELDEDSARSVVITSVGLEDPVLLGTVVAKSAHLLCDPAWNDMDYICKGIISASLPYNNGAQRPACLDFGCWSLEEYQSIPPTVIWALGIAKRGHETNSFQAGRAFEAQLCFACKSNCPLLKAVLNIRSSQRSFRLLRQGAPFENVPRRPHGSRYGSRLPREKSLKRQASGEF